MTVFDASARRTDKPAGKADHVAGNILCFAVDGNGIQMQVADFSFCYSEKTEYVGFQRDFL